ncbi:MAG TPA: TIGR01777 family oxidoreductase [Woeseiaceae bacterium]|nr:TIGR01777 family oxidoreductase [Woeseiaceae bacterium]
MAQTGLRERIGGRVLITGGTGFIGSALAERLLDAGVGVDVLTRDRERALKQLCGRVRAVEHPDEVVSDRDRELPVAIVNLAGKNLGEERWDESVRQEIVDSRVEVTRALVSYIGGLPADRRPRVLVSGSAIGYYGARGEEELDEDAEPGAEFQSRVCIRWESAAETAREYGVRVCLSRTGVVLGRDGGMLSGLTPLFRKGLGATVGSGRQWISWIHRQDLVELLIDQMTDDALAGPFNNTAPEPVRHEQFTQTLAAALNRPLLLRIPAPVYRLIAGGIADMHLTGQMVLPVRNLERGFEYRYAELRPALEAALGGQGAGRASG